MTPHKNHYQVQHDYVRNILNHIDTFITLEQDETLEEASRVYKHLANLFSVLSSDIDKQLSEEEVIVFTNK
jgi:hypothetical protein